MSNKNNSLDKRYYSCILLLVFILLLFNFTLSAAQSSGQGIGQLTDVVPSPNLNKYTAETSKDGDVLVVTNTHIPETGTLNVFLVYDDENDIEGIRPTSNIIAQATVSGNAVQGKSCTLTLTGNSTIEGDPIAACQIDGLRLYNNGQIVTYDFSVSGLTQDYTLSSNNLSNAANLYKTALHEPTWIDVIVNKVWNDNGNRDHRRPSSICIALLKDNAPTGRFIEVSGTEDTWSYTFEDVLLLDGNYSVVETGPGCQPNQQNTQTDCETLSYYWSASDNKCYAENSSENYSNSGSCTGNGFYWYDDQCHTEPASE